MKSRTPKVSVGIPVYNGEDFLAEAIESVLNQTFTDFELLISDNASTDSTLQICRRYERQDDRVKITIHAHNQGAAVNFNSLVERAEGEFFMWLAHDDVLAPGYIEQCLMRLRERPEAVLCFTDTQFIDEKSREIRDYQYSLPVSTDDVAVRFIGMVNANHIVVEIFGLIRREVLQKTRGISSYMTSDIVLLSELLLYGPFIHLRKALFFHREHKNRSVLAHADPREREAWFDARKKNVKFVFPRWRRFFEHTRALIRSPISISKKIHIIPKLLKSLYWQKDILWEELMRIGRTKHMKRREVDLP